jgi:hypothetical protein
MGIGKLDALRQLFIIGTWLPPATATSPVTSSAAFPLVYGYPQRAILPLLVPVIQAAELITHDEFKLSAASPHPSVRVQSDPPGWLPRLTGP